MKSATSFLRLRVLLVFVFPVSVWAADISFDPAEPRCMADDDQAIVRLIAALDSAAIALPNVPPEEDKYLIAEAKAARKLYFESTANNGLAQQSNSRFLHLETRPLYHVWRVRNELVPAREKLATVLSTSGLVAYRKNAEAEKLDRAASAGYAVNRYTVELTELLTRESIQSTGLLTGNQYLTLRGDLLELNPTLAHYMACKLAKVMGRQFL